jgi:cytochrome bd-type quinol oxidase subunit 2
MDARGFARAGAGPRDRVAGWCGVVSLFSLGGAFVALVGDQRATAAALGIAGGVGLVFAVVLASSSTERIRYRPRRMTRIDWVMAAAVLLAPAALAACTIAGDGSLTWFATEPVRWPALHLAPALSLLPLLAPIGLPRRNAA